MEVKKVENIVIKYVRDNNRKPIGVVVAIDSNKIGWSMCHKDDRWNKDMGKTIAINRAWEGLSLEDNIKKAPLCMTKALYAMYARAGKYFNR